MQHEHAEKEHAARQPVHIEQGEQVAVVDALGVHGNTHKKVGKGHAQQDAGHQVGHKVYAVPQATPGIVLDLAAEFKGYRPEDQGEKQHQQRRVQRAEHDRIGLGKCREGHAASGDKPHFVAVPERPGGIVHDAAFRLVFAQKRQKRAHTKVKAVQNEVHGPQQCPQHKPDGFQHGYTSWASGPLMANLRNK